MIGNVLALRLGLYRGDVVVAHGSDNPVARRMLVIKARGPAQRETQKTFDTPYGFLHHKRHWPPPKIPTKPMMIR